MRHIGMPRGSMRTLPEHTHFIRIWIFTRMFLAVFVPGAIVILFWWLAPLVLEWMAGR